ncbi:glycoside hydrolase/deacetylase [Tilletiopsis washingtonensis]|uniref:Glycoside hydrolase/deacetylase n=1 Tax=Tilletiopsis washingtonensis TaxID=58919 RepID=A0A316ZAS5_9BASI|nr:glycoside hydrolase/deacetylase [Tilletiopsis washingtonensis]PWN97303.1 glycoside hydrolase/deacetylase [Tilletiopsis washingtonensis]
MASSVLPPVPRSIGNCQRDLAYSFDAGPAVWHAQLDDIFAQSGGHYTAFVNGALADGACIYDESNVAMLRASLLKGHLIASHTWSGARLSDLTQTQIDAEVELLEEATWKTLGVVPAFIRPPHGACDAACVEYLNSRHGLSVVTWDTDSRDAMGASPMTSIDVLSSCTYPDPHMPLAHEIFEASIDTVAATMAPRYRAMGYELLTVQQCLGKASPYKLVGAPQERDETWTCQGKKASSASWGDM